MLSHSEEQPPIKKEFETSIDGYLNWCKELGQEAETPFSGNVHLR